jgi:hypothetical protein
MSRRRGLALYTGRLPARNRVVYTDGVVLVVSSILGLAWSVAAQAPNDVATARELFDRGVTLAQERQWDDARDAFQRSYALAPRPSTLINLAGAERQSGRLIAAIENYRLFLRDAPPDSPLRVEAEAAVETLSARLAHLEFAVRNLLPSDVVMLDDTELRAASLGVAVPVDPGDHRVSVVRDGATIHETPIALGEGAAERVSFTLPVVRAEAAAPRVAVVDRDEDDDGGTVFESPWFWIVSAAVVAGAVVGLFFVFRPEEDPFTGNTSPGRVVNP